MRLALSTSWLTRRTRPETAPSTPGSFSSAGMPTARRASVCSGTSASRSIAPSSMMRNSGSPEVEAEAPSLADRRLTIPGDGRLHLRPADAHLKLLPLRVAALAVGLGDAERVLGGGQLGLRRLHRHLALLDGRSGHDARLELARAIEIRVRELHLRLRLRDQALAPDRSPRRRAWSPRRSAPGARRVGCDRGGRAPGPAFTRSPSSASSSTIVSPSMRAATCASSRATRVPETNSRSTNSRFVAGTTVTAGGSTTRGCIRRGLSRRRAGGGLAGCESCPSARGAGRRARRRSPPRRRQARPPQP